MRIIKKIVVQMALLGIMSFAAPSIWDGSADVSWYEESAWTYNITTAEQLAGLAKLVNEGVSDFKGKKITLGADIFLNDTTGAGAGTWNDKPHRSWTPIGTESRQFKGEFDGYAFRKNRKIYGLYYNDSKKNYIGIFGSTSGATISNVDLLVGSVSAGDNVGALIGSSSDSSLIKNVHSEIYVVGRNFVGGLVGYHLGNIFNSSVQGSVVGQDSVGGLAGVVIGSVDVSFHNGGDVSGRSYVGGLVGVVEKDSISQAYADGRVIGKGDYIGGLVGFVKRIGKIIDSYHIGGNVEGASYVGGLIGSGFVIYRSHADGYVIGTGDYVGGLAGAVESEIKDSYHIGGNVEGAGYVGGLVGYSGRILQSYADGYVIGTDDYVGGLAGAVRGDIFRSYHTGDVDGASYVGGLVGKFEQKQVTSDIDRSYAEGRVTGRKNYVGGLAGVLLELYPFSDSYVANSEYAYDVVQYSYFIGNVKGVNYVGGAIGLDSIYHGSFKNGVRIIRSIKNINVQGDVVGKTYVGGIVGKMNREKYNASIRSIIDSCDYRGGDVSGVSYVGGVLGYNGDSYCILKNSVAKGNVLGLEMYVGGLAGYAEKIDSCYHTEGRVEGKSYVGGLVGRGSSVLSSHAGGNVTGVDDYVGGLAGFVEAEISDSYHTEGNVEGKSYVGGLVGYSRSISQSYADGMVRGANDVGGLAGYATSIFNSYARANYVEGIDSVGGVVGSVYHIEESFFNGDSVVGNSEVGGLAGYAKSIVDSSYSTACVKGVSNVGGLIGGANGNVSNSYALGDVAGDVENFSTGKGGLGGLVGYQYNGSIRKSMAKGNVSGTINLGGLVGCFYGTEITSSYANGDVTVRYYSDSTDGVGKGFIGGLVGRAKVVTVDESYVSGSIKGSDWIHGGCLVGFAEGFLSIEKSYYDSSKCNYYIGNSNGDSTSKIVPLLEEPKRSTSAMKSKLPFGDYTYTWKLLKNSYPHLFIYANSLTNADVEIKSFAAKYDGFPKIPIVQSVSLFGNTLEYESDYTVDYDYKENVGVVSIKVCGVKSFLGYSGCKFIDFEMSSAMVKPTIAAIENKIYTGKALTPEISVYYGETLLDPAYYSVEYMNNVQVGTANVIVTMKNRFKTTVSTTFKIEMAACEIPKEIVASGKMIVASDIVIGEPLAFSKISSDYNVIFSGEIVDGNYVWKNPNTRPTSKNGYEVVLVV